jgi:uncharacterized protein YdeI (YjbR/CyaY-like superfamily)
MELNNALSFKNRDEWRRWLEKNNGKEKEVWLIHHKKHVGKIGIQLEEAVEEALCFGWIDGKLRKVDKERFILRYSPRKADSVWSKLNRERAERLTKAGKMTATGLSTIEEAKKSGSWNQAYTSLKRDRIPADLRKALKKDKRALDNFQRFANSHRNMYIHWVKSAKTNKTRRERIEKVVKQASQNKKPISHQQSF